jgi:hypothetical protein
MKASKRTVAALAVLLGGLGAAGLEPSKNAVTSKSWEGLHKLLLPQKGDYPWEQVTWYASLWHARKKAAAEDKPIFVFVTGGAGFNDPLGNC